MYLVHHGIKGQKWGVRRYQNEDGTLTEAGKERYGGRKAYADTPTRDLLRGTDRYDIRVGSSYGPKIGEVVSTRHDREASDYSLAAERNRNKAEKEEQVGNKEKAEKYRNKAEQQEKMKDYYHALRDDREAYDRHTSTGKMLLQNMLLSGGIGAEYYRDVRAMGGGRGKAFAASLFGVLVSEPYMKKTYGGE